MILDYSNYIRREAHKGLVNGKTVDDNLDLFYEKNGLCPFCNIKVDNKIFEKQNDNRDVDWLFGTFDEWEYVNRCPNCGWWEYIYQNSSDAIIDGIRASDLKITTSILRKYDIDDKNIAIDVLSNYIKSNPDKIYNIHHKKMEELVQSIFKDFYSCEVTHVGKSHDGGKDLILIESDKPTIIQVKRRTKPNMTEGVSCIRELLGTTLLSEAKSCVFVTTADHYSSMAIAETEKAKKLNIVDKFDLIDCKRFLEMLNLCKISNDKPWIELLQI